ncbi:hypothetical protein NBRC116583_15940 [Arenicella sp. 4NH20-0111]
MAPSHMKHIVLTAIVFGVTIYSSISSAQSGYITDTLEVMMRSGPSNKNKIIKILESGDRMDIIQADVGNNHSEVRIADGTTGYVLKRYITDTPSAKSRVASLESKLAQLRAKPGELQALLATAQKDNQSLIEQNTGLTAKLRTTTEELDNIKRVSSDAVNIANRNTKLEDEVQQLLLQLDDIRIQNKGLKDQSAQRWFLLGGGAILFGLFLGWLLSISKRTRRQSWGA